MVTVKVNGQKQVLEVKLKEDVVDPDDIEMLQDLVLTATNDALKKVDELTDKVMGPYTQGLNVPGLF
jgi:nucleoid-associated protein EbfC